MEKRTDQEVEQRKMTEEEGLNLLGKMVAENVLEVVKLKPFSQRTS